MLIEQAVIETNRVPTGNRGQTAAPVDLFRTRDGWILVQVVGQPLFRRWARLMGEEHWLTDPRFKDDISRGNHGAIVSDRMACWCAERTTAEALETLGKAQIPAGPVLKPQETLDDPQVNAMGFFQPLEFPGAPRPAPVAKVPVHLSETPGAIRRRAPLLGEHTEEIRAELGYAPADVADLRQKGVIGAR
jgi:crotonobetainyl-CoA:carnitine CoA-transferase CaiB-like acyl-CoA transferase